MAEHYHGWCRTCKANRTRHLSIPGHILCPACSTKLEKIGRHQDHDVPKQTRHDDFWPYVRPGYYLTWKAEEALASG